MDGGNETEDDQIRGNRSIAFGPEFGFRPV